MSRSHEAAEYLGVRPPAVVLATTTWYKDPTDIRAHLALEFLTNASARGFTVVVVDGGSYPDWREQAAGIGKVILLDEAPDPRTGKSTMGAGRRQAVREAQRLTGLDGIVLWTEPEKTDVPRLVRQIIEPIVRGQADLVIPSRRSLDSYPYYQQQMEAVGNDVVEDLLGVRYDFWFGVMAMPAEGLAIEQFLGYGPQEVQYEGRTVKLEDRWDSLMVCRLNVINLGGRVVSVEVDYEHPKAQTDAESDPEVRIAWLVQRCEQVKNIVPVLEIMTRILGIGRFSPSAQRRAAAAERRVAQRG